MASRTRIAWETEQAFKIRVTCDQRQESEWVARAGRAVRLYYVRLAAHRKANPDAWERLKALERRPDRRFDVVPASEGDEMERVWHGDKNRKASNVERGLLFALVAEYGYRTGVAEWYEYTRLDNTFARKLRQFSWRKCEADCGGRSVGEMLVALHAEKHST